MTIIKQYRTKSKGAKAVFGRFFIKSYKKTMLRSEREESCKKGKIAVYIFCIFLYDKGEQSRRPRVKCCQNGELSGRRRTLSAMRFPHPLPHNGYPPLWKAMLGWVRGQPVLRCPARRVFPDFTPRCLCTWGFYFWKTPGEIRRNYYGKSTKIHNPVPPSFFQGLLA